MPQILLNCYLRAWWFFVPGLDIKLIWNLAKEHVVSFFKIGILLSSRASWLLYTIVFKICRTSQKYEEASFKSLMFHWKIHLFALPLIQKSSLSNNAQENGALTCSVIGFTENNPADLFETPNYCLPSQWAGNEVFSI